MRRLTNWLSAALQPSEREAVLGDLEEVNARAWFCFVQVLGLIIRRNAIRWFATACLWAAAWFVADEAVRLSVTLAARGMNLEELLLFAFSALGGWVAGRVFEREPHVVPILLIAARIIWAEWQTGLYWSGHRGDWSLRLAFAILCLCGPYLFALKRSAGPSCAKSHPATQA